MYIEIMGWVDLGCESCRPMIFIAQASRALIQRGNYHLVSNTTDTGHTLVVVDDAGDCPPISAF